MDGAIGFGRRWYAVRAKPRKEQLAAYQLTRQGFATFLPMTARCVSKPLHVELALQPFFPGYLFVRLNLEIDRWRSVNGTIGVLNLVQFGQRPSPAPYGLVEGLRDLADDHGQVRFDEALRVGEAVRVIGGAFDSQVGVFEGINGPGRVRVLMQMLSRDMSVDMPRDAVMAIG